MNISKITILFVLAIFLLSCTGNNSTKLKNTTSKLKSIQSDLPIIGLLAYDGVLATEVTAPLDVFTKLNADGKKMFNVIIITEKNDPIVSEEGLKIVSDYTYANCPKLDVLFVPSAYDVSAEIKNIKTIDFIIAQNKNTKHIVSNCAGAQLIGKSGIADGKKIVTWIGGGKDLQKEYPKLLVQDDSKVIYVEDGKFSSSNGNLATYIASLELLEKLTNKEHRKYVESYLYLDQLKNWKQ